MCSFAPLALCNLLGITDQIQRGGELKGNVQETHGRNPDQPARGLTFQIGHHRRLAPGRHPQQGSVPSPQAPGFWHDVANVGPSFPARPMQGFPKDLKTCTNQFEDVWSHQHPSATPPRWEVAISSREPWQLLLPLSPWEIHSPLPGLRRHGRET